MDKLVTANDLIAGYFQAVDSALEILSAKSEGHVAHLPSWTLTTREIRVAYVRGSNALVVQAIPRNDLTQDSIARFEVDNPSELAKVIDGWQFSGPQPDREFGFAIADLTITPLNDQLAPPIHVSKAYIATVTFDTLNRTYSLDTAKDDAINLGNNAVNGFPQQLSVTHNLSTVFDMFQAIIKRKAFLERRIHRFINDHRQVLLPEHRECYFEHEL